MLLLGVKVNNISEEFTEKLYFSELLLSNKITLLSTSSLSLLSDSGAIVDSNRIRSAYVSC